MYISTVWILLLEPVYSVNDNSLNGQEILDKQYQHAKTIWEMYQCHTMQDYHDYI